MMPSKYYAKKFEWFQILPSIQKRVYNILWIFSIPFDERTPFKLYPFSDRRTRICLRWHLFEEIPSYAILNIFYLCLSSAFGMLMACRGFAEFRSCIIKPLKTCALNKKCEWGYIIAFFRNIFSKLLENASLLYFKCFRTNHNRLTWEVCSDAQLSEISLPKNNTSNLSFSFFIIFR